MVDKPINNGFLYEVGVGLIGHNFITPDQAQHIRRKLLAEVLPALYAKYSQHRFSLLTPLAPGSDFLLAKAMGEWFAEHAVPWRLQIVRTIQPDIVVEKYHSAWSRGGSWNGEKSPSGQVWEEQKPLILQGLEQLFRQNPADNQVIRLPPPEDIAGLSSHQAAFQQAARWIVDHADELVAVNDPRRGPGGPGGTQETLDWWLAKDPAAGCLAIIQPEP